MVYQLIGVFIVIVAAVLLYLAAKTLLSSQWWKGFLCGCLGIFLLALTLVLAFSARDIFTYRTVETEHSLATASFHHKEGNFYTVEIQEASGVEFNQEIEGQQWQLDVRMLKWTPLFGAMGFKTGYRLEGIKGRFLELQLARDTGKDVQQLSASAQIDVWQFLNNHPRALSSVEAYISTPGFIPVADGAIFDIVLTGTNLTARPLNEAAKTALASW